MASKSSEKTLSPKKSPSKKGGGTPSKPKKLTFAFTPVKGKKVWGNMVDAFQTDVDQLVVLICTRGDKAEAPYVKPMVDAFEEDITDNIAKSWSLIGIFPRKGPRGVDGEDTELPKAHGSPYAWEAFVAYKFNEDDTPKKLGENLAEKFTTFVKQSPNYDKDIPFRFRWEHLTNLKPLNFYIKDSDTASILKKAYGPSGWTKDDLAGEDEIMTAFFGSREWGAAVLGKISPATWESM